MLKYREYLNQFRAIRVKHGILKFPVHYQLPQQYQIKAKISKNTNTNKLKVTSDYGKLRHNKGNINKNHQFNQFLKTSLKDQSRIHSQIKEYASLSQEKNAILKPKLSQMQSLEQTQKSQLNNTKNIYNKVNHQKYQFVDVEYETEIAYQNNTALNSQINKKSNPLKHKRLFSFCRNNDQQKQKPIIQHVKPNQPFKGLLSIPKSAAENYTFEFSGGQINQWYNKATHQNFNDLYYTNHKDYQIQRRNKYSHHYQPFYKNYRHDNKQQQEKLYIHKTKYQLNPNLSQQPPITIVPKNNICYRQNLLTYTVRPIFEKRASSPLQKGSSQNFRALAKQKSNKLKDDDKQLRVSTIQLLNAHRN